MSQHKFSKEKHEDKEVYPPDPADPFPTEKAVVFGNASATYGSMVAPEVIRPADQLPLPGPQKKEEHSKETKEAADHTVKAAQATVKELKAEQHDREHKK